MRIIITENQYDEFIFKYMSLTIWVEVRNNIELFHSNNGGTGELSQKDMKSFNIRVKKLVYNFCVDRSGVSYSESPELFNLIINSIPDIIEKVDDKKQFLNEIMLGVKQGIKNWNTFSKSDKGFRHLVRMLNDTLFDI